MCIVRPGKTHNQRAWNEPAPHASRYTAHPSQTGTAVARLPPITYRESGEYANDRITTKEGRRGSRDSGRSHGHHERHSHEKHGHGRHGGHSHGHGRRSVESYDKVEDDKVVVKRKIFYR